jgi:hypothetical protein
VSPHCVAVNFCRLMQLTIGIASIVAPSVTPAVSPVVAFQCAVTADPATSASSPIGSGTSVELRASCNRDATFTWYVYGAGPSSGNGVSVYAQRTTSYSVFAKSAAGELTVVEITVYVSPTTTSFILGPTINFGSIPIGQQSLVQATTITNPDNVAQVIKVEAAWAGCITDPFPYSTECPPMPGWFPGDFSIVATTCNAVVPPKGTCTVTMRFAPRGVGERTGGILVWQPSAFGVPGVEAIDMLSLAGIGVAPAPVPALTRWSLALIAVLVTLVAICSHRRKREAVAS